MPISPDDQAFIDGIELALDWGLPIQSEDLEKYFEMIERKENMESLIIKALENEIDSSDFTVILAKEFAEDILMTLKRIREENQEQKAEIERLQQTYPHNRYPVCVKVRNGEIYTHTLDDYDWLIGDIGAEAVTEFANRLRIHYPHSYSILKRIDAVESEMIKEAFQ